MLYLIREAEQTNVRTRSLGGRVYPEIKVGEIRLKCVDCRTGDAWNPPFLPTYPLGLLKSNLQKAIRRGCGEEALATTKQILTQDPAALLRRLPILMCEDTQLHPQLFIEIIWLLAAHSKGYRLTDSDIQTIYDAVSVCLSAPARYNLMAPAFTEADPNDPLQLAFLIRIAYGGMAWDMAFLERLRSRVAVGELPLHTGAVACFTPPAEFDPLRHVLPEAVDFHCYPHMPAELDEAKEAIWYNRSCLNVRPFVGEGAAEAETALKEGAARWPLLRPHAVEAFARRVITAAAQAKPTVVAAAKPRQMRLTAFVVSARS